MPIPKTHSKFLREFFFWTGVAATLMYRAVVFFNGHSKLWVDILWYSGTVGFIIYFAHRYQISEARAKLITEHDLTRKVESLHEFSRDDKEAVTYIFSTLRSSKEKWNYIIIFVSSGAALLLGFFLEFIYKY